MQTLAELKSGLLKGTTILKLREGLTSFPEELFDLADTLEMLDLSGNQLSELPADFGRFKKLKIFFGSDNIFKVFPKVLANCPQLEMIGFKANIIEEFPEDALPPNIRWLTLTNNRIGSIPRSIGRCHKLEKFLMAGNRLTHLPDELANCRKLGLLRISANNINVLPGWLFTMPELGWLAIAGNPCTTFLQTRPGLREFPWNEITVLHQLGEGASGNIYMARHATLGEVAVKVFKGTVTSDGLPSDEMTASMSTGGHANLVTTMGKITGHPEAKQGLVFNLIPTHYENLALPPSFESCTRDVFPPGTLFSREQIMLIVQGMASAVEHLHEQGILHADLYAHNILIDDSGNPLFGDFGGATVYDRTSEQAQFLERIDVCAFGYLLDDLLTHWDKTETASATIEALLIVRNDCLDKEVLRRPDFKTIHNRVSQIANYPALSVR